MAVEVVSNGLCVVMKVEFQVSLLEQGVAVYDGEVEGLGLTHCCCFLPLKLHHHVAGGCPLLLMVDCLALFTASEHLVFA